MSSKDNKNAIINVIISFALDHAQLGTRSHPSVALIERIEHMHSFARSSVVTEPPAIYIRGLLLFFPIWNEGVTWYVYCYI
jgi:hypothetical protein